MKKRPRIGGRFFAGTDERMPASDPGTTTDDPEHTMRHSLFTPGIQRRLRPYTATLARYPQR